jgi:hypothetical protein
MALAFVFFSCGGKGGSDVKVSAEMKEFMGMLKGNSTFTTSALAKFASTGLDQKDMEMYGLENPKVVSADKECYTMEVKSGITTRVYIICWEGGKIKSIEDKGFKPGG